MSNTFFQFKKFRIDQDRCAMKVCTDSCLLGAFAETGTAKRILDIGTGTGLLALMLAQKSEALIDAVEVEDNAFHQAKTNFMNSPWKERLTIYHDKIQTFAEHAAHSYDLIISNPPFFSNQLKSPSATKNIALHSEALSLSELIQSVVQLLSKEGTFLVLLPLHEFELLKAEAANYQLFLNYRLNIKDRENLPLFRVIARFTFQHNHNEESELIIKNNDGSYSEGFTNLLKEYYLHL